jgi:hypothetical protein
MTGTPTRLPLARSEDLLAERVGPDTVVYDAKTNHAHSLGPLAGFVFSHCDGRTSLAALAELAGSHLEEPVSIERIEEVLGDLDALSLLEASDTLEVSRRHSRRQLMRKGALAGAAVLATPFVTSVTTPALAAACTATACTKRSNCEANTCTTGSCVCVCSNGTVPPGNSACPASVSPGSCGCR